VQAFYDNGGKVIATGTLPSKSAEFGHDDDVKRTIGVLFPGGRGQEAASQAGSRNERGGMAVFLKEPTAETLQRALDRMLEVYDVEFEAGQALRYIHKIHDGRHIYFLAHLGSKPISTWVELRGALRPELWDPHTGAISKPEYAHEKRGAIDVTRLQLELSPTRSVFIAAREGEF
jgi:hypothetical protein